jgi:plastocyanin
MRGYLWIGSAALAATVTLMACGGGDSSPTSPTPAPTPTPTPTPGGTTITLSANAASPQTLTVARGTRVTFVNSDSRNHDMNSDPHPAHTDCPELNDVGFLTPGQSRQTGNLNTARTCGFHDHNQPSVGGLQGRIVIQ